MGTRNITAVVLDGEYRVAQYCQWDGDLSGQGMTIAEFIQHDMRLSDFRKAVAECFFLDAAEVERRWKSVGADNSGYVSMVIADRFSAAWPQLDRNMGADVLRAIQDDGVRELKNDIAFISDSLFCEWAYVLDLDNEAIEVFKGFNTAPLDHQERFSSFPVTLNVAGKQYWPIKLLRRFRFSDFDYDAIHKLIAEDEK